MFRLCDAAAGRQKGRVPIVHMKTAGKHILRTFGFYANIISVIGITAFAVPQDVPVVRKVEPPNWWVGHSINPVRLLVNGRNFTGAHAESPNASIQIRNTRVSENGDYIFLDIYAGRETAAGIYPIKIVNSRGSATVPFEMLTPLPRAARFQGFSSDDVIYLIMPDRFSDGDRGNDDPAVSRGLLDRNKPRYYHGGDLLGIINHLPYLKDLGTTAIWINPVYDNVNHLSHAKSANGEAFTDYHGYGAVDFYGVEEHFGDLALLRRLVDEAHRLGLKVIQDQVANHTGPYHPWVGDPPTPTWYNGTDSVHLDETWQTWTLADVHATPQLQAATLKGWFGNMLPDLNQDDEEVARYIIQNTLWWVGMTGFDGIRQDTLPYVPRRFWSKWSSAIKREYPNLSVVGEMWDADPALVSFFQGGHPRFDGIDSGIDALFDFPLFYSLRKAFAQGQTLREVAQVLGHDYLYTNSNMLVTFLGLHDVERFMNERGAGVSGMNLAYTFLMTARGIPLIYYGDEIGMPGGSDPDNRRDFPGGWPGDPRNAFLPGGRTAAEEEIFSHVRHLTHLRAELEALRRGGMVNLSLGEQTWAYARITAREKVIVVLNNAPDREVIPVPIASIGLADGATLQDRLGVSPDLSVKNGGIDVPLNPRSGCILTVK